jgi:hypothetical protein
MAPGHSFLQAPVDLKSGPIVPGFLMGNYFTPLSIRQDVTACDTQKWFQNKLPELPDGQKIWPAPDLFQPFFSRF